MKKLLPVLFALLLTSTAFSQKPYEVLVEKPNEKTYKGIISKEILLADTSFSWYTANTKGYKAYPAAITNLKKQADSVQLLVFMGTWCEDSHFIIPKLFSLADTAGFSADRITLVGVDRNKKTTSHLSEALNITNVPTIIVYKNGKEYGRVVEYGKQGLFDKDLAEILGGL